MRINLLYVILPLAIGTCYYIVSDLRDQGELTFFGTAETEPTLLNMDQDVLVREVRVKTGNQIKQGDTLAILYRAELEREILANKAAIREEDVSLLGRLGIIQKERESTMARAQSKIAGLQSEITAIQVKDSIDQGVKSSIYAGLKIDRSASSQKISALRAAIEQERTLEAKELAQLDAEATANRSLSQNKKQYSNEKQRFQDDERQMLVLIAPVAGYVDQVNITERALVPAYKDMVRIYPLQPNKVVGFIHESTQMPFKMGDLVHLESVLRPTDSTSAQIIAANPKLVELPLRLRKFVEVRAWGREVITSLPPNNNYYIGEKISITLKAPAQ